MLMTFPDIALIILGFPTFLLDCTEIHRGFPCILLICSCVCVFIIIRQRELRFHDEVAASVEPIAAAAAVDEPRWFFA